ncbi:hypothetical protein SH611_16195 [Geminicoccaceae bacterium 1502E]|nr:hypothetical protein [Geminicoccaceae bacterium 1502E]
MHALTIGPAGPPRRRARRRLADGLAVTTPLAATFMGFLVMRQGAFAGELPAEADQDPALPADRAGEAGWLPGAGAIGRTGGSGALPAFSAPGSLLDAGGLIEPRALAAPGGAARFADSGFASRHPVPAPAAEILPEGSRPAAAAAPEIAMTQVTLPPMPLPEEPEVEDPDEDLGPIGEHVEGDTGNDTLIGTEAEDTLIGGAGDDRLEGRGGRDTLYGGAGDDMLLGGAGDDRLDGGEGDDRLEGEAGDDVLEGGEGDDVLLGGVGSDRLSGGPGNDFLDGGPGADDLSGGAGDDMLVIDEVGDIARDEGGGNDTLVVAEPWSGSLAKAFPTLAPAGTATFLIGDSVTAKTLPAGYESFRQQVHGGIENVRLEGIAAHDVIGDGRANIIEGNAGDNRLHGGAGDDRLLGGDGDDMLWGGDGDDWLDGGAGQDILYGGAGDDTFVLGLAESSTVFDHEGRNTLRLEGAQEDLLSAFLDGGDLRLLHDGVEVALLKDYAGHEDAFAGIDLGHGPRDLAGLIRGGEADLLADFMPQPGELPEARQAVAPEAQAADPPELDMLALASADLWAAADVLPHGGAGEAGDGWARAAREERTAAGA